MKKIITAILITFCLSSNAQDLSDNSTLLDSRIFQPNSNNYKDTASAFIEFYKMQENGKVEKTIRKCKVFYDVSEYTYMGGADHVPGSTSINAIAVARKGKNRTITKILVDGQPFDLSKEYKIIEPNKVIYK